MTSPRGVRYGRRMEPQGDRVGVEVWVLLVLDVPAVIFTVWLTSALARDGVFGELWRQLFS
jgi:hypothetical protein